MSNNPARPSSDLPVYLFTGFLDGGKTTFIQDALQNKNFQTGQKTLLLICEEGEEEYYPDQFLDKSTYLRTVEKEDDLCEAFFDKLYEKLHFERMIVEYNGMWKLDSLYQGMPEEYVVVQEFMFADATTFLNYNANMRQLVYDKVKSCELAVFNRFPKDGDQMPIHKIVRAINRSCDIAYEATDGTACYDDIEDPLPFDKEAAVIEIEDRDYALWYQDLCENGADYNGKVVRFKCQVSHDADLAADTLIVGRPLMNCCAADTAFAGMIAMKSPLRNLADGAWVMLTASVKIRRHPSYEQPGPVLTVQEITPTEAMEDPVATFY